MAVSFVVLMIALAQTVVGKLPFSGDQVWILEPDTPQTREIGTHLEMLGMAVIEDGTRIRVKEGHLNDTSEYLELNGIDWEVIVQDVAAVWRNQTRSKRNRRYSIPYPAPRFPCTLAYCPEPPVDRWLTYDEVTSFVLSVNTTHSERARTTSVGKTAEGRDIWMVTVHKGTCDDSRGIYVIAGSQAREFLGAAVAMNLIWRLIYDCEVGVGHSFYVIPLLNPDGYEYTRTTGDTMWRKNRATIPGSTCLGVNLDRNMDFHWGESDSSSEPCSEVYNGGSAMSELESQALDVALAKCLRTNMVVSLSSSRSVGGESVLYPWSYTSSEEPANLTSILDYAEIFRNASFHVHNTNYSLVPAYSAPVPHSGTITDWAMGIHGANMAFVVRLRGDGTYANPVSSIQPTAEEFWAGFHALSDKVARDFL